MDPMDIMLRDMSKSTINFDLKPQARFGETLDNHKTQTKMLPGRQNHLFNSTHIESTDMMSTANQTRYSKAQLCQFRNVLDVQFGQKMLHAHQTRSTLPGRSWASKSIDQIEVEVPEDES